MGLAFHVNIRSAARWVARASCPCLNAEQSGYIVLIGRIPSISSIDSRWDDRKRDLFHVDLPI